MANMLDVGLIWFTLCIKGFIRENILLFSVSLLH